MKTDGPVILAAFANDHSDQARFLRNLSTEAQRIQKVLEPAAELCPLVLLPGAKLEDILDAFQKYRDRVVVFHYAGHANGFQLLLESASGGVHRIGAKGLASFLGQQQGLQLVFLNGCSTERQAEDLLAAGVGCVIATTQAIDDAVATDFSSRFYKGIVTGAPLQAAYSEAVGAAQAFSGGSIDRLLVPLEGEEDVPHETGRWPWLLKLRPGAERVAQWSLPEAAGDPLFGLPPVKPRDLPESPYRHLYRFEAEHAEVFFGRGHEIRELYQRVTAPDSPPVVLFYGPAGVGKSSLLDAGLIPRLEGKHEVHYERREPTIGLGNSLRLAFPMEFRSLSRRDAWIAAEKKLGRPLDIVLDQVEEAFTKPNPQHPNELAEFAQLLRRVFHSAKNRPRGRLILGFRKEWFAEIDERLAEAQVPRSRIFLERLSRHGAIEAITGPVDDPRLANHYKLTVEAGLPEVIADDLLADPDTPVAPTLQILLTRMWSEACRRNREKPKFDAELYQSLHRDGILLDDFLKQQTELIRSHLPRAVDSGFLLDLLVFHTTAIGTSAEHPVSLLEQTYIDQAQSGLLAKTLKLCEESYLLMFAAQESDDGKVHRSSRLLHDTLAPLIRARHEESDLPGQRVRRILDNRIVDWADGKVGIPLDVKDLKEVESAFEGTRKWSADEQRLVTASREERASNLRWRRIFKGLGTAAVVLIAVTGTLAYWQSGKVQQANAALLKSNSDLILKTTEAEAESQRATSAKQETRKTLAANRFTSAATARDVEHNYLKAAHLYAAAAEATDDPGRPAGKLPAVPPQSTVWSFAACHSIGDVRLVETLTHKNRPVHEAWLLQSGEIAVWWGSIGSCEITLWGAEGIKSSVSLESVNRVFLSADESKLIAELEGGGRQSIDTKTWERNASAEGLVAVASPMSNLNQSAVTARLADAGLSFLDDAILSLHGTPIYGVDISADQSRVLIWTAKYVHPPNGAVGVVDNQPGVVQVWDTQARAPITPPLRTGVELRGAKFAANDEQLLMWTEDGRVLLWDISRCHRISDVQVSQATHPRFPEAARQDGESSTSLPGSDQQKVCWDYDGWWIEPTLKGQANMTYVRGMDQMRSASEDGMLVLGWGGSTGAVGTGSGGFVGLWHTDDQSLALPLMKHPHAVCCAQSAGDSERMLTSTYISEPGNPSLASVHLWHVPTNTQLIPPIPVFNNTGAYSEIDPAGRILTIRTQSGADSRVASLRFITYKFDIAPDPEISTDDPRLDMVIRTGTYLDRFGAVTFLPRESWKSLRDRPVRPSYEEWVQELENPPQLPVSPPAITPKMKEMLRRRKAAPSSQPEIH